MMTSSFLFDYQKWLLLELQKLTFGLHRDDGSDGEETSLGTPIEYHSESELDPDLDPENVPGLSGFISYIRDPEVGASSRDPGTEVSSRDPEAEVSNTDSETEFTSRHGL